MSKYTAPNAPGYVCPKTGRIAVLAADFACSDLNGEAPAYLFNAEADSYGLDGWKLIEGVDPHTTGSSMDIWGAGDWVRTVGPNFTIFVDAKNAALISKTPVVPSPALLREWASDPKNTMCWGLDALANELETLRAASLTA